MAGPVKQQKQPVVASGSHTAQRKGNQAQDTRLILQRAQVAPGSLRPADILQLQRTIGNRATGRLLSAAPTIQAKMEVGPVNDRHEQEADRVAKEVVRRTSTPQALQANRTAGLQRQPLAAQIDGVQRAEEDELEMKRETVQRSDEDELEMKRETVQRAEEDELEMKRETVQRAEEDELEMKRETVQRAEEDELEMKREPIQRAEEDELEMKRETVQRAEEDELEMKRETVQRAEEDELEMKRESDPSYRDGGALAGGLEQSIRRAKGGGRALDQSVQRQMESGFGATFGGVRIHTDASADKLTRSVQAKAFTTGKDIFFKRGEYNPGSRAGKELLAHELTHTVQQGAAGVQRQALPRGKAFRSNPLFNPLQRRSTSGGVIQRAPNLARLEQKLGRGKYGKVVAGGQTEYFDKLTDDQLDRYKRMQNDQFVKLVNSLKESLLGSVGGGTATVGQVVDLLGAVVETGEEASKIIPMLPQLLGSLSTGLLSGGDTVMEGLGGGIGGIKDTIEGGSSIVKQQKYVEGGLTTLGGLSGLASLIPGVPDFVGMAGAGAKSAGGIAKMSNVWINQSAIKKLRSDGTSNIALNQALDVLDAKLDHWAYIEGAMQTGLGAVEGVGAFYGSISKYVTGAVSKGTETAYNWLPYLGRAIGSYTGLVDSNTTVKEKDETEKSEGKKKMWAAVESVESGGLPEHIGRLRRLAVLIEPDYAEEIDHAVSSLRSQLQQTVKKAIQLKATWNPS